MLAHPIIHIGSIKIDYTSIDSYKVKKSQEQNITFEIPLS